MNHIRLLSKTTLFICIYLFISFEMNAQIPILSPFPKDVSNMIVVDSGNIRVWYALNAADIENPNTYDDLQRLEIGKKLSKYFSHFIYNSDSLCTDWGKKHKGAKSAPNRMGPNGKDPNWSEYYWSEYFKDYSKNIFTEYARMPWNITNYQYSEDISIQNWEVQDDTLTIASYLCQKAVCNFRGRSYTAWFTLSIPINNGPWKFGGLPGLILKVYDEDKLYIFECIKLENHKKNYTIKIYDYENFAKIERKRLLKLQKEIHEDYFKVAGLIPMDNFKKPDRMPYNGLELE